MTTEKVIRRWRVRAEGPGYFVWFDPSLESIVLYGTPLAYEVREGREASEAGARHIDQSRIPQDQLHFAMEGK